MTLEYGCLEVIVFLWSIQDIIIIIYSRMTEPQMATVCVQVLSALAFLHAHGVIHRWAVLFLFWCFDVVCENINLWQRGVSRVALRLLNGLHVNPVNVITK